MAYVSIFHLVLRDRLHYNTDLNVFNNLFTHSVETPYETFFFLDSSLFSGRLRDGADDRTKTAFLYSPGSAINIE